MTKVYLGPMGKGTVPSGPNCVCAGESGENLDTELFVSGPQPVARGIARPRPGTDNYILLATHCYVSKFSFVERTVTVQLSTDGGATCRIVIYVQRRLFQCGSDGRSLCIQISRERSYPLPIY